MKIHILGSCSGTEPMPGRHQTSLAFESNGNYYWFDAGENNAYTAYLAGIPFGNINALFISHGHIDHVGGLPHLLFTISKIHSRHYVNLSGHIIKIFTPGDLGRTVVNAAITMLGEKVPYTIDLQDIRPGLIFANDDIAVEALPNAHIPNGVSFSFRIRMGGKTIVFSGDIKSIDELAEWLEQPCDELLMETGHHQPADICRFIKKHPAVKHLTFVHHGRTILEHLDDVQAEAAEILGEERFSIAQDAQIIDFDSPSADR